jgi:hypothetical protein
MIPSDRDLLYGPAMTAPARTTPRHLLVPALLLAAACEQPAPIPVTYVPQAPAPASAGTPEQRAERQLERALAPGAAPRPAARASALSGVPTPASDLEIGGGDAPEAVPQIGIPLR